VLDPEGYEVLFGLQELEPVMRERLEETRRSPVQGVGRARSLGLVFAGGCAVILEEPRHHRRAALPPVPPPRRNGPAHRARSGRNVRDKAERAGSTRGQGFPVRDPRVLVRSRRRGSVPAGARRLWPSLRSIRSESSKARNFAACLTAANGAAARRPRQVCQLRL